MPELLVCEFMKLKRKKLIPAIVALSVLFPLLVVYVTKSGMSGDMSAAYLQQRFDNRREAQLFRGGFAMPSSSTDQHVTSRGT